MSGVLYVIDQLGAALAEANRRIVELEEEITRLRAAHPEAGGDLAESNASGG